MKVQAAKIVSDSVKIWKEHIKTYLSAIFETVSKPFKVTLIFSTKKE